MALSIGVSAGSKIKVGKSMVAVQEANRRMVTLKVDGGPTQIITEAERTEILPQVYVFIGVGPDSGMNSRLAFEAPRSIQIDRVRHALHQ
jgi:hypothetical protein